MTHRDIPNLDEKINLVIGNLLSTSDEVSKSVLSAFDSSKDLRENQTVLSSSRFKGEALNACAQYLDIDTTDATNGSKIFSNKPSLAKRIILEIQSLYPAICADCDSEYSIAFKSSTPPSTRCFLCFQGCHDCQDAASPDQNPAPLKGSVWLCKSCHELNNPIKAKKPKSTSNSKQSSRNQSKSNTPRGDQTHALSTSELTAKLESVARERDEEEEEKDGAKSSQQRPNLHPDQVCAHFVEGKCPHGVTGKTAANGKSSCDKPHPKRCMRFIRNVTHKKYGCRRGNKCMFFHPKHCPTAIADKCCYSESCTLVHPIGTKRRKPQDNNSHSNRQQVSSKSNSNNKYNNDVTRSRKRDDQRGGSSNRSRRVSFSEDNRSNPSQSSSQTAQQQSEHFLEIRSLLSTIQLNFQKEIDTLKLTFASQEGKLAAMISQVQQPQMRHFIPTLPPGQNVLLPHHQMPPHNHPPHHHTSWTSVPVSGC